MMRDIPGFENYAVTKGGRVWSKPRKDRMGRPVKGRWLILKPGSRGYVIVVLYKNERAFPKSVHHLVLETFIGPCPPGQECRHLDGNRRNNCLDNLKWGTKSENNRDAVVHKSHIGLYPERRNVCKLSTDKVRAMRYLRDVAKFSFGDLAWQFDVSRSVAANVCNRKARRHVA